MFGAKKPIAIFDPVSMISNLRHIWACVHIKKRNQQSTSRKTTVKNITQAEIRAQTHTHTHMYYIFAAAHT